MNGSFWVQGTGGSGEGFADVWINEKNPEAELVQPRRRIPAQYMCDGVGKKKNMCFGFIFSMKCLGLKPCISQRFRRHFLVKECIF